MELSLLIDVALHINSNQFYNTIHPPNISCLKFLVQLDASSNHLISPFSDIGLHLLSFKYLDLFVQ
ncbi:hypothetical protein BHE74_00052762 [Ensete ventricosum]|nr:hypothetical protein GW17_00000468 [Ensete ventricosum]RWW41737.1 hypothetical protein BHE74_00052762 [Ensete ventricosum]